MTLIALFTHKGERTSSSTNHSNNAMSPFEMAQIDHDEEDRPPQHLRVNDDDDGNFNDTDADDVIAGDGAFDVDRIAAWVEDTPNRIAAQNDGFSRRLCYKFMNFTIYLVGAIPAAAILAVLYYVGIVLLQLQIKARNIGAVLFALCVIQPLGSFGFYYCASRQLQNVLPGLPTWRLPMILVVGSCCFHDGLLTKRQTWRLAFILILESTFFLVSLAGTSVLFLIYQDGHPHSTSGRSSRSGNKDDTSLEDILIFACCCLPAVAWYFGFKFLFQKCSSSRPAQSRYSHLANVRENNVQLM